MPPGLTRLTQMSLAQHRVSNCDSSAFSSENKRLTHLFSRCANLELTFADRLMKQYNHSLCEETATNDTRWTVEWLFDSAFNHTEESISCMATLTSLHLWAFIATKYSEWKTLAEEKEQAEAYLLRRDLHKNSIEGIQSMPSCQIARNFSPEGKKLRTFREELKASYPLNLKPPTSCIFSHNTAGFLSLSRNF